MAENAPLNVASDRIIEAISQRLSDRLDGKIDGIASELNGLKRKIDEVETKPALTDRAKSARVPENYQWEKQGTKKQYDRITPVAEELERVEQILPTEAGASLDADKTSRVATAINAGMWPSRPTSFEYAL